VRASRQFDAKKSRRDNTMATCVLEVTPWCINQVAAVGPGARRTIVSRYQLKDVDSVCRAASAVAKKGSKHDSVVVWLLGRAHWFTLIGDTPPAEKEERSSPSADFYGAPAQATVYTAADKCDTFIQRVRQYALALGAPVGYEEDEDTDTAASTEKKEDGAAATGGDAEGNTEGAAGAEGNTEGAAGAEAQRLQITTWLQWRQYRTNFGRGGSSGLLGGTLAEFSVTKISPRHCVGGMDGFMLGARGGGAILHRGTPWKIPRQIMRTTRGAGVWVAWVPWLAVELLFRRGVW